jgi:hypothetical protein
LRIDSKAYYNGNIVPSSTWQLKNLVPYADKFFNFRDIKPGDYGKTVISMHSSKGDPWLCLAFDNFQDDDNGQNEPESSVDTGEGGELGTVLKFFAWIDDGDNKYEIGERHVFNPSIQPASLALNNITYAVNDSEHEIPTEEEWARYVGLHWCAGHLTVHPQTAEVRCDGSKIGNAAQTDIMSVAISIKAVPEKENPNFVCANNENEEND